MLIVYVKHYLTKEGRDFFHKIWFVKVKAIISQQSGFISITHDADQDKNDCINITVKFNDELSAQKWAQQPNHDDLVNELDNYRSRNYWEVAKTTDESIPNLPLRWEKVIAAT